MNLGELSSETSLKSTMNDFICGSQLPQCTFLWSLCHACNITCNCSHIYLLQLQCHLLSPLLYSLYTHDCTPTHPSNTIIKFADDTTVIGLISGGDETAYRDEVNRLAEWCSEHNLLLNTSKTKEMVIDLRKHKGEPAPLNINGDCVQWVFSFKFLGTHLSEDLSWTANTSKVVKGPTATAFSKNT